MYSLNYTQKLLTDRRNRYESDANMNVLSFDEMCELLRIEFGSEDGWKIRGHLIDTYCPTSETGKLTVGICRLCRFAFIWCIRDDPSFNLHPTVLATRLDRYCLNAVYGDTMKRADSLKKCVDLWSLYTCNSSSGISNSLWNQAEKRMFRNCGNQPLYLSTTPQYCGKYSYLKHVMDTTYMEYQNSFTFDHNAVFNYAYDTL